MADGSYLTQSANSGNSNFYLFNNNSGVQLPPTSNGFVGYNNSTQSLATIVYISHITRDNIDVEIFYSNINQLSDLYIQDQNNSSNFIKYNITGNPSIVTNSYVSIPVTVISSGGTGSTSFGNGHDILVSFFSNLTEVDTRLSAVENKTQNLTAGSGYAAFSAILSATSFIKTGYGLDEVLLSNGSVNSSVISNALTAIGRTTGQSYIASPTTKTVFSQWVDSGTNRISSSYVPISNTDLTNKLYGDTNYVNKSGNGGITGTLTTNGFIISGGSGFVLANGNYDTSTYLTTTTAGSTYVSKSGNSSITGTLTTQGLVVANKYMYLGNSSGMMISSNDTASIYIGTNAGGGSVNLTNITGTANFLMGQNVGFQLTSGYRNVGIGDGTLFNCVTGYENTCVGDFAGISVTGNRNTLIGGHTNSTGSNNTCLGYLADCGAFTNSTAIGNGAVSSGSNQIVLGDANITNLSSTSLICDLGNTTNRFKDIYYSGNLISGLNSVPDLTAKMKPNLWWYITTTATFLGGIFTASTQITAIGGTLTQIATANTNWRTRKTGRINCPTSSVADGARSGFIGTATFPVIYVESGWLFSYDFSITDTNTAATSICRMFCGFGITTTAPALSSTVAINSLQNMIGVGCDTGDTVLSFYSRGATVGTANGTKVSTPFSCSTPSTKIFSLTFYNPTNSDVIIMKLYDQETDTSVYQSYTLGLSTTPISTSPLVPVWVRAMATSGGVTGSAQLGLNGFKWYTL